MKTIGDNSIVTENKPLIKPTLSPDNPRSDHWKVFGDKDGPFTFQGHRGQYQNSGKCCRQIWWQGDVLNQAGNRVGRVENGVIHFQDHAESETTVWPESSLARLREEGRIRHNWTNEWEHARNTPERARLCELALETGGPILDIASGPGGGNLSPLLHMNPGAPLIISDIQPQILHMWREHLEKISGYTVYTGGPKAVSDSFRVCFAAFDACHIPIMDNSVACISSHGGLSNLVGHMERATGEIARVLQPEGLLVVTDMEFTGETIERLPDKLRKTWSDASSLLSHFCSGGGWRTILARAGLEVLEDTVAGQRTLRAENDSGLARMALQYGVTLDVEFHYMVATKPARPA